MPYRRFLGLAKEAGAAREGHDKGLGDRLQPGVVSAKKGQAKNCQKAAIESSHG